MKGYQVIEPRSLNPLMVYSKDHVFAVTVFTWLCEKLRLELEDILDHVEFEVICVTYLGSYPAIGIHYKNPNYGDVGPLVEASIGRLLRGKSVLDLVDFIAESKTNWHEATAKIMARVPAPSPEAAPEN